MRKIQNFLLDHMVSIILGLCALSMVGFLVYNSTGARGEQHRAFTEKCRIACYPNPVEIALVDENRCECNMKRLIKQIR
jgi:hypothetical protein